MRSRLATVALLTLLACGTPRQARSPVTTPPAEPPTSGNFTLYVSNQSFDRPTVDIAVDIDGRSIVGQDFAVEGQHTWKVFALHLKAGEHALHAVSIGGAARLTVPMTTVARNWAVVDYWCCGQSEDPKFTFHLSDKPIVFG